jgi:hypothetical protein
MVEEVNNSVGDENLETSTNANTGTEVTDTLAEANVEVNTGDVTRSRSMRRRWSIRNIKWLS